MAKFKFDGAFATESVDKFGGIDSTGIFGHLGDPSMMTNFRILPDGSIEKRCGHRLAVSLPFPIDDVISQASTSGETVYALAGGRVYIADVEGKSYRSIGTVAPSAGGCFFRIGDMLCLIAGDDIFIVTPDGVYRTEGYVPLYGDGWSESGGEVNEPLNLFSDKVRINYRLQEESALIYTGLDACAIDSLTVNGAKVRGAAITEKYIALPAAFAPGSVIDVVLSMPYDGDVSEHEKFLSCRRASTLGTGNSAFVCLFGGDDGGHAFISRHVDDDALERSLEIRPECSPIYFPTDNIIKTDILGGIRAISGERERLIVFGKSEVRLITRTGESCSVPGRGCASHRALCRVGDSIYAADELGVFRLKDDGSGCEPISTPVGDAVDGDFWRRSVAHYDTAREELLFSDCDDDDGRVMVYNLRHKVWYIYDGFGAECFFGYGGRVCFIASGGIFEVNEDYYSDTGIGGEPYSISATYTSRYSTLSRPGEFKRVRRLLLCADGGNNIDVTLSDAIGTLCTLSLEGGTDSSVDYHDIPIVTGRAKNLRIELSADGEERQHIYGFTLGAVK